MSGFNEDRMTEQDKNQHDDQRQVSDSEPGCSDLQDRLVKDFYFTTDNSEEKSLLIKCKPLKQFVVATDVESKFEECVKEVNQLLITREELIQEISNFQPMEKEVQKMRLQLLQVCGQLADVQVQKQRLQQEIKSIKRKLFATTRDCIQNQITLEAQWYEVEQSALTQVIYTLFILNNAYFIIISDSEYICMKNKYPF